MMRSMGLLVALTTCVVAVAGQQSTLNQKDLNDDEGWKVYVAQNTPKNQAERIAQWDKTKKLTKDKREATAFLVHIRKKRSAYEECREGCWWEEIEEIWGYSETSFEYMRWWRCTYSTRCSSGYYCDTHGGDYSHISRLAQRCSRHGGWCGWASWGWGSCSTSCNSGTQSGTRSRSCSCPTRVGGGNYCSGSSSTSGSQSCTTALCSCGNPGANRNSTKSGTNYLYQSSVSYTCHTGYTRTSGSSSITCQYNAQWSGSPAVCNRVSCPSLSARNNATQAGSGFKYLDRVSWGCNTGYEPASGSSSVTCQSNGQWSSSQLTCKRITCPTPTRHNNATQVGSGYRYLDSVTWSCKTGYERSGGSYSAQCQANTQWSASPLTCTRITCPTLSPHNNATQTGSASRYLDIVSWSCHNGYERASGNAVVQCQSNKAWNGTVLACKRVTCLTLSKPQNGTKTGSGYRYLDRVTFACDPGYEQNAGAFNVQCQANRAWSGAQLTCTRITCPTLTPHNNATQNGSAFRYLDHVSWSCNSGYEPDTGDAHVQCQANKAWNGTNLTCKRVTCPTLTPHNNATQTGSAFRYLDHVSWSCNTGYEPDTGDAHVQCQANRKWNGTVQTCKRITCPTLTTPRNGTKTGNGFRYLDHVSFVCDTGYERGTGDTNVQCQANGAWNGTQLTCKRITCQTLTPHNNATQTGSASRYLDHVSWSCNTGYEPSGGDAHVQCQANRVWNGTNLTCKRVTCPTLTSHNNATQIGSAFRYLDNVSWSCNTGYEPDTGDAHVQCQANRKWNGTVQTCKRITCPTLTTPQNGTKTGSDFRYLDHVSFMCDTGYERDTGDSNVQCQANRAWNGTQLTCKRITCQTLTSHNNATQTGRAFRYLDHVSWSCNTGYEPSGGDTHVQCQANKAWNGTNLTCKRITCPTLTSHNNATQTGSAFQYMDHVSWSCNTGYEPDTGDAHVQCQANRQWNGTVRTCKRITCPTLTTLQNGTKTGSGYRYRDHVSFMCDTGHERDTGDSNVQCQANRAWNGTQLTCKRITCQTLTPHNNATQTGSAFRYLDHVSWSCNTGYEPDTGDAHVQCQANKQWNGTALSCKRITCPTLIPHNNATQAGSGSRYLDHVRWSCNTGYEPDTGDHHVQCQATRAWNGTALTCKRITCPTLTPHNNATQTGSAFRYLDHVSWSCNSGYEPSGGDAHVQCQDNKAWNGTNLACKRITCNTLTPHNNATQTGIAFRYLDHVSWSCNTGYKPDTGDAHVQCQANRQWNGTVQTCKRITCPTLAPHNNATQTGSAYRYLDHVSWSCNTGYERDTGDYHVQCQANTQWNGTKLACKRITCPTPAYVSNSSMTGIDFRYMGGITYTCELGYELKSGTPSQACQANRTWSGTTPFCGRVLCKIAVPDDAHIKWSSPHANTAASPKSLTWAYLDWVNWECNPGYSMTNGHAIQACQANRTFNGTLPVCTDINECQGTQGTPCLNGALCSNLVNSYSCKCVNGFTGVNCETAPTMSPSLSQQLNNAINSGALGTGTVNSILSNGGGTSALAQLTGAATLGGLTLGESDGVRSSGSIMLVLASVLLAAILRLR